MCDRCEERDAENKMISERCRHYRERAVANERELETTRAVNHAFTLRLHVQKKELAERDADVDRLQRTLHSLEIAVQHLQKEKVVLHMIFAELSKDARAKEQLVRAIRTLKIDPLVDEK